MSEEENKSLVRLAGELEVGLIESGGELTEALAEKLAQVAKKVDGSVFILERFDKIAEHYAEKARHLEIISAAAIKANARLREYIKNAMELMGTTDLDGEDFRFKTTKSKPTVIIKDQASIPEQFMVIKTTKAPDKNAISKAIESGQSVIGADLEYSVALRIYPRKP